MNTWIEFFDSSWLHALGYTLLNSLWQALIIAAFAVISLRFIPTTLSNTRYAIASIGLILMVVLSIGTFFYLYTGPTEITNTSTSTQQHSVDPFKESTRTTLNHYFNSAGYFIQSSVPFFVMAWAFGSFIFSMRILIGLLYVEKLKRNATFLENEWNRHIQLLRQRLNIKQVVQLAESSAVQVPIVIGYLKPLILIPVGMCTSLSTAQLETIFLHELTHIRRNDYVVNLIQVIVESIYFFNPFVWIISGLMKSEREHCCDDAVIKLHGSATEYVHALATLEEVRLSRTGLSLSLAENKNQLFNRIKRIMEKSVRNYSSRERILPALLLVMGLICASWISNQTYETEMKPEITNSNTVVSDTTKKDKKNRKNKKVAARAKEKAETKEEKQSKKEISESPADKDYDLDLEVELDTDDALKFNPGAFPIPDVDLDIPLDLAVMAPLMLDLNLNLEDFSGPGFSGSDGKDWEKFAEEFEENFKSKFGDFYDQHGEEIERMIEEAQEKVNSNFDENWEIKMQEFARKQEEWAKNYAEKWEQHAGKISARHEEQIKKSQEDMQRSVERHQKAFEKNQQQFEKKMKDFEENNKRFEEELISELTKDGYLSENEKLENMHWHNGKIEINGKPIKPSDEKKYNELHQKYFTEIRPIEKID
jgi:beta-lactamase regulating signal transducer with metallopeptidase domain